MHIKFYFAGSTKQWVCKNFSTLWKIDRNATKCFRSTDDQVLVATCTNSEKLTRRSYSSNAGISSLENGGQRNKSVESFVKPKRSFASLEKRILESGKKMTPVLAPTVKLNNGYEMPVLGLGTYEIECHPALCQKKMIKFCAARDIVVTAYSPLARPKPSKAKSAIYLDEQMQEMARRYRKTIPQIILRYLSKNNEGEIAVKHAIDVGYRHIDTAYFYQNEAEIGKAIRDKIAEGVVKREDIFLVTKLWNIHHEPHRVEGACRKQLELLGLEYIDLYLMHLPVGYKYVSDESLLPKNDEGVLQLSDVDYVDTYKAMEKLVDMGLVRSIGVSNFNSEQIKRVLDSCQIKPVTNQVECSPALNQKKLTKFCHDHDITLTAYSPLGRPKPEDKKPEFYYNEKTQALADKYAKSPAQIILRYLIDIGTIPIPKSSNPNRIEENFNVFDFKLTPEDIAIMDSYNTGERLVPFNLIKGQNHKYWPFSIEF